MELKSSVVLITGASSGIGEATARELASAGARLTLVARRMPELRRVASEIAPPEEPLLVDADITSAQDRRRIRAAVEQRFGALNVLINNAGITAHGRFDESDLAIMRSAMELNFFAAAELTQELLPLIKRAEGARRILLVSTPSGLYGVPGRFAYSASKAAGHVWMETMRSELHGDRIRTVIYCPGYVRTNLRSSGLAADGSRLSDEQASGAISPQQAARRLLRALRGRRRIVLGDKLGRIVYWLRTLAPGLLEWLMRKRLKKDFQKSAPDPGS
ncbi:MAG: SDR family oxidoreductase [Leptospirales bacterium]|nr:SDR family oxidoreductase [Leptospirales bacterium]